MPAEIFAERDPNVVVQRHDDGNLYLTVEGQMLVLSEKQATGLTDALIEVLLQTDLGGPVLVERLDAWDVRINGPGLEAALDANSELAEGFHAGDVPALEEYRPDPT